MPSSTPKTSTEVRLKKKRLVEGLRRIETHVTIPAPPPRRCKMQCIRWFFDQLFPRIMHSPLNRPPAGPVARPPAPPSPGSTRCPGTARRPAARSPSHPPQPPPRVPASPKRHIMLCVVSAATPPGCGEPVGERPVSATVRRCMRRSGACIGAPCGFRHRRSPRGDSANGGGFFIQSLDALTCRDRKPYISS